MCEKLEDIKISVKKIKSNSIQIKVDLYEVFLSHIFLSSILFYEYTNTIFLQICGISLTRIKEFRKYCPKISLSGEDKATGEFLRSKLLINGFNEACKNIAAIYLKVGYEYMGAIRFRKTTKGNLPHLSYILC